jgi:hypothetical protein
MPFATTAKNLALDAITVDRVRLHSGAPGAAGTDNTIAAFGLTAATFNAASSAERVLASDVTFTGGSAAQSVTHFSVWLNSGTVFRGGFSITSGAVNADGAGQYVLKATTTKLTASD